MKNSELLKAGRDSLLSLHKILVDSERARYEALNGKLTSGQFLNLLIEDTEFSWLRRFSTLIVDIDEMFAQKDGFDEEAVLIHLSKLRQIVAMQVDDTEFVSKYRAILQQDPSAASRQDELANILR